ncbi:hypothetical protein AHAS_Ahas10G0146800 [Arachis hypogaea]
MSDKRKGKASSSKKRKKTPDPTFASLFAYAQNPLNDIDKANQLLPAQDTIKFPNLYCELKFPSYNSKNLNTEKKLAIPSDLTDIIHQCIDRMGGIEVPITEQAIEDALTCRPKTSDTDAFLQAEIDLHCMTFDFRALRAVVATPDAPWVMDADNKAPKGMHFSYLSREAKTWQQIFAHYVMPTTHFTEILVDMLILISCVMEGKEVYYPQLIRRFMWRAHIRGIFPFPVMVTQMIQRAGVPWHQDDVAPPLPLPQKEPVIILWGSWVHEKPASRRRSRARAAVEGAGPSSSSAPAGASTAAARQPIYLLVQHLFRYMERSKRQIMHCLDRIDQMFVAQGLELPPLPESSGFDEETHEEEHADLHTKGIHADEPAHMEAPP